MTWPIVFSTLGGALCGIALASVAVEPRDAAKALGLVLTACVAFACAFVTT